MEEQKKEVGEKRKYISNTFINAKKKKKKQKKQFICSELFTSFLRYTSNLVREPTMNFIDSKQLFFGK